MKKILLIFLLFFSIFSFSQEEVNINDSYLHELLLTDGTKSIIGFDDNDIEARKNIVDKITSYSYIDPSFLKTYMVLNMLKYKLGDEDYKNGVNAYLIDVTQHKKEISASSLIKSLEDFSNQDLSEFYNDWFLGKGYPTYEISWFQNEKNNTIDVTVNQTQSDDSVSFFEMPLPVRVSNEKGNSQIIRLEISEDKQSFTGYIPFKITSVDIDPEHQLITKNNIVKSGMDQEELNNEIALYPNPAKSFLNIQNSSEAVVEKVSIFDMLGKLVLQEINPISSIDLKPLSFGLHLVKIETSQGTLHKTILKQQ